MAMTRLRKQYQPLWGRAYLASSLLEACGSTGPPLNDGSPIISAIFVNAGLVL